MDAEHPHQCGEDVGGERTVGAEHVSIEDFTARQAGHKIDAAATVDREIAPSLPAACEKNAEKSRKT